MLTTALYLSTTILDFNLADQAASKDCGQTVVLPPWGMRPLIQSRMEERRGELSTSWLSQGYQPPTQLVIYNVGNWIILFFIILCSKETHMTGSLSVCMKRNNYKWKDERLRYVINNISATWSVMTRHAAQWRTTVMKANNLWIL